MQVYEHDEHEEALPCREVICKQARAKHRSGFELELVDFWG